MESSVRENSTIRITMFYLFAFGFGVAKNQKIQYLLDMMLISAAISQFCALFVVLTDMYYSWGNFYETSYALISIVLWSVIAVKFVTFSRNRQAFVKLMVDGKRNLWHGMYSEYGKTIIKKCEEQSMLFIAVTTFCAHLTGFTYALEPMIENIIGNESVRVLPFNNWMFEFYDLYTPYYEMLFIGEMLCLFYTTFGYICFDNFLTILNIYISGHFDILRNRLETLYNNSVSICYTGNNYSGNNRKLKIYFEVENIRKEFAKCIKQHQLLIALTDQVETVFSFTNLVQILVLSLLFCLVAYQLILPGNRMSRRGKFMSFLSGCMLQLFTFAYSCNNLTESSAAVCEGTYYSKWNTMNSIKNGRALTKDLIIVIMRTQRPCCLTAWGFYPVNVNTLKTIVTTAFSYLTLMRESS